MITRVTDVWMDLKWAIRKKNNKIRRNSLDKQHAHHAHTTKMGLNIDFKLLPMKAHYFLYNGGEWIGMRVRKLSFVCRYLMPLFLFISLFEGTGSVVPFMPVYARQLGFSTFVVGSIYSILPILGLVAKPLFGALADKFVPVVHFDKSN